MNHLSTRLIVLFCAAGVSVCATGATPPLTDAEKIKAPPVFGQLAPAEVQTIQGLGRAVLAAKGAPDAYQEALRNDLKALSTALDKALITLPPAPVLRMGKGRKASIRPTEIVFIEPAPKFKVIDNPDGGDMKIVVPIPSVVTPIPEAAAQPLQNTPPVVVPDKERYAVLRSQLSSVRQRIDSQAATPPSLNALHNARTAKLLAKSKALHDEFIAALDEASTGNVAKLISLRDRLHPKTLEQFFVERKFARLKAGEQIPVPAWTGSPTRHRVP